MKILAILLSILAPLLPTEREAESKVIVQCHGLAATEQCMWTTIMRVDNKLAKPIDRYYLWTWAHDSPVVRLYTAPQPTGPWKFHAVEAAGPPTGYDPNHWSAGDVVWHSRTRYFYSSPHSIEASGAHQPTFIIRSRDGIHWNRITNHPLVDTGDAYSLNYGRFLRDPKGSLVKVEGKYVWYYRLTFRTSSKNEYYKLGFATSSDLRHWRRSRIFDISNGQIFALGSAIREKGRTELIWSDGLNQRAQIIKTFHPLGIGTPFYTYPSKLVLMDGGSLMGKYLAFGLFDSRDWSIRLAILP